MNNMDHNFKLNKLNENNTEKHNLNGEELGKSLDNCLNILQELNCENNFSEAFNNFLKDRKALLQLEKDLFNLSKEYQFGLRSNYRNKTEFQNFKENKKLLIPEKENIAASNEVKEILNKMKFNNGF